MLHIDLSNTFGIIYCSLVIATTLFGISVVQGYLYFIGSASRDRWFLKGVVFGLLALDLATTVLIAQSLYFYLIKNYGNPLILLTITKPFAVEYLLTVIITFVAQIFYASQIYAVNKDARSVTLIICAFAICSLAGGVAIFFELFLVDLEIEALPSHRILIASAMYSGFAVLCDMAATVAMFYYLSSQQTEYKGTRALIKALLFFSVNRGLLVTIAQTGHIVAYLAAPSKEYWMPFHISQSKLYVNMLLAMSSDERLNSRASLRARTGTLAVTMRSGSPSSSSNQSVVIIGTNANGNRSQATLASQSVSNLHAQNVAVPIISPDMLHKIYREDAYEKKPIVIEITHSRPEIA